MAPAADLTPHRWMQRNRFVRMLSRFPVGTYISQCVELYRCPAAARAKQCGAPSAAILTDQINNPFFNLVGQIFGMYRSQRVRAGRSPTHTRPSLFNPNQQMFDQMEQTFHSARLSPMNQEKAFQAADAHRPALCDTLVPRRRRLRPRAGSSHQ